MLAAVVLCAVALSAAVPEPPVAKPADPLGLQTEASRPTRTRRLAGRAPETRRGGANLARPLAGEFLVDRNTTYGPAHLHQFLPAVATDGTNYLVVWVDDARDYPMLRATLFSRSGRLLDSIGFLLPSDADGEAGIEGCWPPSATFDGTNYIVAWGGVPAETSDLAALAVRISPTGTLLDSRPIVVHRPTEQVILVSACAGNGSSLVVWVDDNGACFGARLSAAGAVLDPGGFLIAPRAADEFPLPVAFSGVNWLVGLTVYDPFIGRHEIGFVRVGLDGAVLDSIPVLVTSDSVNQFEPAVSFDGTNYLIAWQDERDEDNDWEIYAARVSPAGVVLDPGGFSVTAGLEHEQFCPVATFDGASHIVAWLDENNEGMFASRISPAGVVLDSGGRTLITPAQADNETRSAIAGSNGQCLAVAVQWRYDADLVATRIGPGFAVLDSPARIIAWSAAADDEPALAGSPDGFLSLWRTRRRDDSAPAVYAARITPAGVVLDPQGIPVARRNRGGTEYPRALFDGRNWLVLYTDRSLPQISVAAARVTPAGTVLDHDGIILGAGSTGGNFAAAVGDSNALAVWTNWGWPTSSICFGRISRDGNALDPNGIVLASAGSLSGVTVAYGAGTYLVLWNDGSGPRFCRIAENGTVLDPGGTELPGALSYRSTGAVSFDGTNFVVAWEGVIESEWRRVIRGTRIPRSGPVLDPDGFPVCTLAFEQRLPRCASAHGVTLFTWISGENGNVYASRVTPSGLSLDPEGVRISDTMVMPDDMHLLADDAGWTAVWNPFWGDWFQRRYLAAHLTPAGAVDTSFAVTSSAYWPHFRAAAGAGQTAFAWVRHTQQIGTRPINADRVWARLSRPAGGGAGGWQAGPPLPGLGVREGGALAASPDDGRTYAVKGGKALEFWSADPLTGSWQQMPPVPAGEKPLHRGAALAAGSGEVFLLKGNNTLEFWRYGVSTGEWQPAAPVPLGGGKKVKAGAALALASRPDGDFVFLLKGANSEFYRYSISGDSFTRLADAPAGAKPKYGKGSWLAWDGQRWLYCHKGGIGELHRYDIIADTWQEMPQLAPFPRVGRSGRSRKTGSGSAAAWGLDALHALKGNNTAQFWRYEPDAGPGTWTELESIPWTRVQGGNPRRNKAGSALAFSPVLGVFTALTGNKTNWVWRYTPDLEPSRLVGTAGEPAQPAGPDRLAASLLAGPGLGHGSAVIRYAITAAAEVRLEIYDNSGRRVRTLARGQLAAGTHSSIWDGTDDTGRRVGSGVYLIRLTAGNLAHTGRLTLLR